MDMTSGNYMSEIRGAVQQRYEYLSSKENNNTRKFRAKDITTQEFL